MTQTKRQRKRGARAWLTQSELVLKYGSESAAQAIVDSKVAEPKQPAVRFHPDCPNELATC